MDEKYLLAAARYVELNPVRAKLAADAAEYPWSSAGAHMRGIDDDLVAVAPLLTLVDDWRSFLAGSLSEDEYETMRKHERTGRPLGNKIFIDVMEGKLGKILTPKKGGRPKQEKN